MNFTIQRSREKNFLRFVANSKYNEKFLLLNFLRILISCEIFARTFMEETQHM